MWNFSKILHNKLKQKTACLEDNLQLFNIYKLMILIKLPKSKLMNSKRVTPSQLPPRISYQPPILLHRKAMWRALCSIIGLWWVSALMLDLVLELNSLNLLKRSNILRKAKTLLKSKASRTGQSLTLRSRTTFSKHRILKIKSNWLILRLI